MNNVTVQQNPLRFFQRQKKTEILQLYYSGHFSRMESINQSEFIFWAITTKKTILACEHSKGCQRSNWYAHNTYCVWHWHYDWQVWLQTFSGRSLSQVCLHHLLRPKASTYSSYQLRKRKHPYLLPTVQYSQFKNYYINRCLFKYV